MYQILGFLHDVLHMSMAFSENERRDLRQQFYDKILNLAHENHIIKCFFNASKDFCS